MTSHVQGFCNSWRVRNFLVIVLRLNKSLKLAESIISLHPHQAAQAQHQNSSLSTVYTPLLACRRQCQRRPISGALNLHAEWSSPYTTGNWNISNYSILNTFKLHARKIWPFAVRSNALDTLSDVNFMVTKIPSKTLTHFPTLSKLKTSQSRSLNHCHLLCCREKHTPAPALCRGITLQRHGIATPRVALRRTYKTNPTTIVRCVKSTNISSVGSRRRACRHTMTTCWTVHTPLCISPASKTGMASTSSWLTYNMIRLSGSGNYTLSRVCDGMTITNALSITGVMTSSKAWDAWCGSQPMPKISFILFSINFTDISHRNTSIPKCTLRSGGGRHTAAKCTMVWKS